jgi:hypothetical protein
MRLFAKLLAWVIENPVSFFAASMPPRGFAAFGLMLEPCLSSNALFIRKTGHFGLANLDKFNLSNVQNEAEHTCSSQPTHEMVLHRFDMEFEEC